MWRNLLFYSRSFLISSLFHEIRLQRKKDTLNPVCPLMGIESQQSNWSLACTAGHSWLYTCFAHWMQMGPPFLVRWAGSCQQWAPGGAEADWAPPAPDTAALSFASSLKDSWISDPSLCADPLCEGNSILHLSDPIQRLVKELHLAVPCERSPGCKGQRHPATSSEGLARPREPGHLGHVLTHQAPSELRGSVASLRVVSHVLCPLPVHCSWPEKWLDGAGATLGFSAKVLKSWIFLLFHQVKGAQGSGGARQGWVVDTQCLPVSSTSVPWCFLTRKPWD